MSISCVPLSGVEVKFKGAFYQTYISCIVIPELNKMEVNEDGLLVGSAVSLTRLADKMKHLVKTLPGKLTVDCASVEKQV